MNKKIIIAVIAVLFLLLIIPATSQASGYGVSATPATYGTSSVSLSHSSGATGGGWFSISRLYS